MSRTRSQSALVTQGVIVAGCVLALIFVGLAVVAIRRDYAGRARAEAELSRFFDLSLELFVISSADGYFKRMSRAVTEMLGYSVEEALRIPYMELIHPDDRSATTRRRRVAAGPRRTRGTVHRTAIATRTAAGARFPGVPCLTAASCTPRRAT